MVRFYSAGIGSFRNGKHSYDVSCSSDRTDGLRDDHWKCRQINDGVFAPMADILIPFVGLTLGAGINLKDVVKGGPQGILLGLITVFVGGFFTLLFDRLICKQPGYAAFAVASTAGNSVAVPAAVVLIDKTWAPYQAVATTQLAASVVVTAILVPIVTSIWAKKYGCPQLSSK